VTQIDEAGLDLVAFEQLADRRRTSLLVDADRAVPDELIDRLCRLVFAAPNHKRTNPWQVAVFVDDARATLGEVLCSDLVAAVADVPEAKVDKTRTKYLRAPVVVMVGCRPDADPIRRREDQAAVAAGVENLLLGATAAGLASMWSSPPTVVAPRAAALAGFERGSELIALVYIGWPTSPARSGHRAQPVVTWHRG
jgi:nitroreductase